MPSDSHPTRVRYFTGQFLQAEDLNDDQNYHRQMRWRHNLALHSWGIVAGLDVEVNNGEVTVSPGMALDGYGRELVLAFQELRSMDGRSKSEAWDVWLIYSSTEGKPESTRTGCPGASRSERYQERPLIQFRRRRELTSTDPSRPNEVPVGDLAFGPNDPLPLSQDQQWPVFLGKLTWKDNAWQLDTSERRYAGLIAEQIVGPKRTGEEDSYTLVVNGKVPELAEFPFAVVEKKKKQTDDDTQAQPWEMGHPWLGMRELPTGGEQIEWNANRVIISGDLTMLDGAALEFLPTPYSTNPEDDGDLDRWLLYHDFVPPKGPTEDNPNQPVEPFSDELRINIPNSQTGANGRNSFVVGTSPDGKEFVPILRVRENQTVEVYGELLVKGRLEGTPTVAPGGPGGIPSVETVLGYLKQHLDQAAGNSQQLIELQEKAVIKLIEDGRQASFAQALTLPSSQPGEQHSVATPVWANPDWQNLLGQHAAVDEDGFMRFLDALPEPVIELNAEFHHVSHIGNWLLKQVPDADNPGHFKSNSYIEFLPPTFPVDPAQATLKKMAEVFNDGDNEAELEALLEALFTAAPTTLGPAVVDFLWADEDGKQAVLQKVESTAEGRRSISDRLLRTNLGRDALIAAMKEFTNASTAWPNYPPSAGETDDWPPDPDWVPPQSLARHLFERINSTAGTILVPNPTSGEDEERSFKQIIHSLANLIT